jgi:hypothetical protein
MKSIKELSSQKCPLCTKPLASEEYDQAISKLENQLQENFDKKNASQQKSYELELEKIKEKHEVELLEYDESHTQQLAKMRSKAEESYEIQLQEIEKRQLKLNQENDEFFKNQEKKYDDLKAKLVKSHEQDLVEKSKEIEKLEQAQKSFKKKANEEASEYFEAKKKKLQSEISERDVQINRFSEKVESLEKQLKQSQSELKGEVGELDLLASLTEAFPNDHFRRQKRGTSSGDVMHQIRENGKSLDIPIVYDNKAAKTVTKNDIEKAKKYQKIHGTNYVIIVSARLPKTKVPNGLYGAQDGILLVHPSILVEITKQLRNSIIEISKLQLSTKDQKSKQTQLYEYMIGSEFSRIMDNISTAHETLYKIQSKEEKDHQTLWKARRHEIDKLVRLSNDFSSGVESITQTSLDEIKVEVKK